MCYLPVVTKNGTQEAGITFVLEEPRDHAKAVPFGIGLYTRKTKLVSVLRVCREMPNQPFKIKQTQIKI